MLAVRDRSGQYAGHDAGPREPATCETRPGSQPVRDADRAPRPSRPAIPDPPLSEATLARLWAGQRFPASALVTAAGVPMTVLHPGRPGRGAGPDFRDALIGGPSGRLLRGDVELHVRQSDFHAHGHDRDRRYDRVVLHVVFDADGAGTRLRSGREVPVVALAPWLRRRARQLAGWLQSPPLWREPCHDAIARLGRDGVARTLDELGERRFEERVAALDASLRKHGPGEALYRALVDGLGYGGDSALFARVAESVTVRELLAAMSEVEPQRQFVAVERLLVAAAGEQGRHTGRPANRPSRRLAGLARLIVRHRPLLDEPKALAALADQLAAKPAVLIASWTVGGEQGAPIGRSRAIELLVNAVLPWAAALEDDGLSDLARQAFASLPRPARYGALAFLEANLRDGGTALPLDARRQQGLLALFKSECTQGGCGRCELS